MGRFDQYDPSVAVLGDAYTPAEAKEFNRTVQQLREEYPYKAYAVVPKCAKAFDLLDDQVTLGYAMGTAISPLTTCPKPLIGAAARSTCSVPARRSSTISSRR